MMRVWVFGPAFYFYVTALSNFHHRKILESEEGQRIYQLLTIRMLQLPSSLIKKKWELFSNFFKEKPTNSTRIIRFIGIIEILIGSLSLLATVLFLAFGPSPKTANILIFVVITGTTSTLIGGGILKHKKLAYQLLLYFSSVIILSKILLLTSIINLNGALKILLPSAVNSWISIFYHTFVIYYLCLADVKKYFVD